MQLLQNNNNKKAQFGFLESAFPSHEIGEENKACHSVLIPPELWCSGIVLGKDPVALKIKSGNFSLRHQFLLSLIELSSPKLDDFFGTLMKSKFKGRCQEKKSVVLLEGNRQENEKYTFRIHFCPLQDSEVAFPSLDLHRGAIPQQDSGFT
ncbi:hypothetical protein EK904_013960 [Melospiza melodia maxima]|nr:hypothetical protein EK904_013960 [Melospiza melodia maxima]